MTFVAYPIKSRSLRCFGLSVAIAIFAWGEAVAEDVATASVKNPTIAASSQQELDWGVEIYVGGLKTLVANVKGTWDEATYELASQVKIDGLAGTIFKAQFDNAAQGVFLDRLVRPKLYETSYQINSKAEWARMEFNDVGPVLFKGEPAPNPKYPVSDQDKFLSVDPMSAFLMIMMSARSENSSVCDSNVPIFDGTYRYDLHVDHVRDVDVKAAKTNGVYAGPGMICNLTITQVAGFGKGDWRAPPSTAPLPVTMAKLDHADLIVPLRAVIRTPFGAAIIKTTRMNLEQIADSTDHGAQR